ncbi:MAG: hypothetical protein R2779_08095 [Crocinitomicaceae bacterium]
MLPISKLFENKEVIARIDREVKEYDNCWKLEQIKKLNCCQQFTKLKVEVNTNDEGKRKRM